MNLALLWLNIYIELHVFVLHFVVEYDFYGPGNGLLEAIRIAARHAIQLLGNFWYFFLDDAELSQLIDLLFFMLEHYLLP